MCTGDDSISKKALLGITYFADKAIPTAHLASLPIFRSLLTPGTLAARATKQLTHIATTVKDPSTENQP